MNIQGFVRNARLCVRSEALIAEIRLRTLARKMILTSFAVLTALMGLAFINMALFVYLQSMWGPVWTPLAIGLANFALAALALLAAMLVRPGPELAMAEEMRKLSGSSLEGASDSNIARLLIPAVISIVSAMRHRGDTKKTSGS